jgi:hypothetical protein
METHLEERSDLNQDYIDAYIQDEKFNYHLFEDDVDNSWN